jgi:hypothetical protein
MIDVNLGLLGQLILKYAIAKYIEAAGTSEAMIARAANIKAIATEIDSAVLGTITVAELTAATQTELAAKSLSVSNQILVTGLFNLVTSVLPAAKSTFLSAAIAAEADVFLKDVIAVAAQFGQ